MKYDMINFDLKFYIFWHSHKIIFFPKMYYNFNIAEYHCWVSNRYKWKSCLPNTELHLFIASFFIIYCIILNTLTMCRGNGLKNSWSRDWVDSTNFFFYNITNCCTSALVPNTAGQFSTNQILFESNYLKLKPVAYRQTGKEHTVDAACVVDYMPV